VSDYCSGGARLPDGWQSVDILFADDYHDQRGNTDWQNGADPEKEQALLRAWDYIKTMKFRPAAYLCDATPEPVKEAQCVLALEELKAPGFLSPVLSKDDFLTKKDLAGVVVKEWEQGVGSVRPMPQMAISLLDAYAYGVDGGAGASSFNSKSYRGA
jgi:hypothetical protein